MSEDFYAKPDRTKKVRFQLGQKEEKDFDISDDISNVTIYDNYFTKCSSVAKSQDNMTDEQQQTTSTTLRSEKGTLPKAAAVFLGLLCLLLLATVIILVVLLIQDNMWNMERNQLWIDIAILTNQRDELQKNYNEMENINHLLIQTSNQLENEKKALKAFNKNLTNERDALQYQIETTCCLSNWIKFGDNCYLFSTSKKNWADSREVCEHYDAQLLIISSPVEQEFISLFNLNTWIGLTDVEKEKEWRWVNGTKATTVYWAPNQPDNKGVNGQSENCAVIQINGPALKSWNDVECSHSFNFICERVLQ